MLNTTQIENENDLAKLLERCGFSSESPKALPVWLYWEKQLWLYWEKQYPPRPLIARFLTTDTQSVFIVAIYRFAFRVYRLDSDNKWFSVVAELFGDITEEAFTAMIRRATNPNEEIKINDPSCLCLTPVLGNRFKDVKFIGFNEASIRDGQASIKQCTYCERYWLRYFFEEEYATAEWRETKGEWYMGLILPENIETITPETAINYLEGLDWYFVGGSGYGDSVIKSSGKLELY